MKCLRCGRKYENPVPETANSEGTVREIATVEWCSDCNRLAMSVVFRDRSAYYKKGNLYDPIKEFLRCS